MLIQLSASAMQNSALDSRIRHGVVFRCGTYSDKGIDLVTPDDIRQIAAQFTAPVPFDDDHDPHSPFEGKLGHLLTVWSAPDRDGQLALWGAWQEPEPLAQLLGDTPRLVSATLDWPNRRLHRVALTTQPRVPGAVFMHAVQQAYTSFAAGQPVQPLFTGANIFSEIGLDYRNFLVYAQANTSPFTSIFADLSHKEGQMTIAEIIAAMQTASPTERATLMGMLQAQQGAAGAISPVVPAPAQYAAQFAAPAPYGYVAPAAYAPAAYAPPAMPTQPVLFGLPNGLAQQPPAPQIFPGAPTNAPFAPQPQLPPLPQPFASPVQFGQPVAQPAQQVYGGVYGPPVVPQTQAQPGQPLDPSARMALLEQQLVAAQQQNVQFSQQQQQARAATIGTEAQTYVGELVQQARLTPAQAPAFLSAYALFAVEDDHDQQRNGALITFAMGNQQVRMSRLEFFKQLCSQLPAHQQFGERVQAAAPANNQTQGSHLLFNNLGTPAAATMFGGQQLPAQAADGTNTLPASEILGMVQAVTGALPAVNGVNGAANTVGNTVQGGVR